MNDFRQSRRGFLKTAAITVTAFTVVPRKVLGGSFLAPSDELTKAIIGVGGMGRGHIGYPGSRLTAIC
ncbi:MAG: twin-arginine translocation signal domain-containing protein, partial [Prevotellaceae bacterium]|nr:twin-arginine translocation signal domain-containing protein [Prevotellaceae bacterium]